MARVTVWAVGGVPHARHPWAGRARPDRTGAPPARRSRYWRAVALAASSPAHQFFTVFGAALAGIGLIFLLVGWIIRRASRSFRGPAERTQGVIVGFDTGTPGAVRVPGTGRDRPSREPSR